MTATATHHPPTLPARTPPGTTPMPNPIPRSEIIYPESDGKPMADNTRQFT